MASVRTKFSVGLFVILGFSLVVVSIIWLGMSDFFQKGHKYVAYFDESVQGLNQDSAVKYRGVDIGRVNSIRVAPDGRLIQVVFSANEPIRHPEEIVAQLKAVGITGIMFLELDRTGSNARHPVKQKLSFTPEYPVIATRPSDIAKFLSDIHGILSQLKSIDFIEISKKITNLIDHADKTLTDADIKTISDDLKTAIKNTSDVMAPEKWHRLVTSLNRASASLSSVIEKTGETVSDADAIIKINKTRIAEAITQVQKAAEQAEKMFSTARAGIFNGEAQMERYDTQIEDILKNIRETSADLNELIDRLDTQPSRLFFSEPLPERKMEPSSLPEHLKKDLHDE